MYHFFEITFIMVSRKGCSESCVIVFRYLVERLDNMKKNVLGNGTSQCLLCGEEFGLLGASACECEECSKVGFVSCHWHQ